MEGGFFKVLVWEKGKWKDSKGTISKGTISKESIFGETLLVEEAKNKVYDFLDGAILIEYTSQNAKDQHLFEPWLSSTRPAKWLTFGQGFVFFNGKYKKVLFGKGDNAIVKIGKSSLSVISKRLFEIEGVKSEFTPYLTDVPEKENQEDKDSDEELDVQRLANFIMMLIDLLGPE